MVVWCRDDYLKEAPKQLEDKNVYEEIQNDHSTLANTIMQALEKVRIRGDLSNDTLNYFLVKDPKFARCNLLPKTHKSLHNVPGRPVISNCRFYTEYLLISRPSFTTYSSESEFIHEGYKSFLKKN